MAPDKKGGVGLHLSEFELRDRAATRTLNGEEPCPNPWGGCPVGSNTLVCEDLLGLVCRGPQAVGRLGISELHTVRLRCVGIQSRRSAVCTQALTGRKASDLPPTREYVGEKFAVGCPLLIGHESLGFLNWEVNFK